jgi:hypothetical protein
MDISAPAFSLAARLKSAIRVTSFRKRREVVPLSLLILSRTSAGNRMWCYVIARSLSVQFLCSCRAAVPPSRPAVDFRRRAQGPSNLAVALTSPLARRFQAKLDGTEHGATLKQSGRHLARPSIIRQQERGRTIPLPAIRPRAQLQWGGPVSATTTVTTPQRPSWSRARRSRSKSDGRMGLEHTVPFERAIDLVEDLETQHTLQLGLAQMSASLLDRPPLHQKSGLPACGIGWRFSLK